MDLNILTESDIVVLESVLDTHLSKKDLQNPEKVEYVLNKIKDEIENPRISNVIVNKLVALAIAVCIGAVLGVISGVALLTTGSLATYIFCLKLIPIVKLTCHVGMISTLSNREDRIVERLNNGIIKLESKKKKEEDPEKKKYLQENINALKESLKIAQKAKSEIKKEKTKQSIEHPVRTFASKFFVAN